MPKIEAILRKDIERKDGLHAVYVQTTVGGVPVRFSTKVLVNFDEWDPIHKTIRGYSKEINDNNLIISNSLARINDIMVKYRLKRIKLSPKILRKEYNNPTADIDFYKFWKMEQKNRRDFVTKATDKQHSSVLEKLKRFRATCFFSELDKQWVIDYQRYCKELGKNDKKIRKNNQNTINKNLKTIKVYIKLAMDQKKLEVSPFEQIRIKRVHPDFIFLEESELAKLVEVYNKDILPGNLQATLRRYLFSCFTGLRMSDSRALTYDNIIAGTLVVKPVKTKEISKIIRIPLINRAKELLTINGTGLIFNQRAEQTINRDLKKITDLCGIKKTLRFHSARHTFATLFYKRTKNIIALQQLLGHSDIEHTMIYTHLVGTDIEEEMRKMEASPGPSEGGVKD